MIQAEKQHSFNHRYKIIKWGPRYQSTIVGSQNPQSGQSCNEIMKAQRIRVKERSMNLEPNAGSPIFSRSGWQQTEGAILRLLAGLPDPSPKCHCCGAQCCELWLCYHTCVCNQELKWKECATAWFTGENFCPVVERRKKLCIVLKERRLEEKKK
jgi:hypothetical protein